MRLTQYCSAAAILGAATAVTAQPADTAAEARWFSNVRQVTTAEMGLQKSGEAYFSPDGKRICFQAFPKSESEYQIYVINLDGSGLKMISTGKGATTCSYFSPDGGRLQFASNHLDTRTIPTPEDVKAAADKAGVRNYQWSFFPGMDIFEYDFATEKTTRIVETDGYDAEGSYSPDGRKIVFTSNRDGDLEIYVADRDGSNAKRITRAKGYDGGPFFSPDGKHVIYRSDRYENGNLQIFINNLEGTAERALTDDKNVLHWCPYWHPSGKWLIFTRAEHSETARPNYDLYLLRVDVNAKGSKLEQPIRVTNDPAFDGLPVFSNDGRKLMWTSKRGGIDGAQVFVADFQGLSPAGMMTTEVPK